MRNVNLFSVAAFAPPTWPKKLTNPKRFTPFIAGLALLLLLFAAPNNLLAQCSWTGQGTTYFLSQPTRIPCGSFSPNQSAGSGTYNYFYAYNGINYTISTCGSSFDTQLSIYDENPGWTSRAYNDDNGPDCTGNNASLTWTSTYTGNHIAIVNRFNCQQHDFTGVSAVLKMRENLAAAPGTPTGGGSFCATSATLTRSGAPGTGYIWYWQNTSGGTNTGLGSGATFTATASGTYYVRPLSSNGCWGNQSAGVAVTLNSTPGAPTVGGGGTFCTNGSVTITGSSGAGTVYYQGTNASGTATNLGVGSAAVTSTGTYYFRVLTGAGCWGPAAGVSVTINPVPAAVSVNGGTTQCGGSVTLTATGGSGGTIYWQGTTSGGTSTATASTSQSVTSSGTYFFNSRSAAGCWGTQGSASVTINPIPGSVTVSGGGTFCGGTATITATGGSGGTIYYQGTDPNGTSTATGASTTVSSTGTYYFRSLSPQGCWGPAGNTVVIINPVPAVVSVSGGGSFCGGTATLTASGGAGGTIYYQGTTSGGFTTALGSTPQTVSASGTYYFRSFNGNCWGPEGSATVTINSVPADVTVSGGGTFCTNGSQTLTASGGGGGTVYWQGTTSNGTSTATAATSQSVSSSGTYYFRSRSAAGCWGNQGVATITINPIPAAVTVSGGGTGCNGQATLTASGGSGGTIYWQNTTSGGTSTATPATTRNVTSSGTYYFRSFSGNCWGPEGSATVSIVSTINLTTGGGTTQSTCGASNGTACISASGGNPPYTYAWSGGGSTSCKSGVPSGNYTVTVTDNSGCTATSSVNVTDAGSPVATITTQTNVSCFGGNNGSATVSISGGTPPYDVTWSNGNLLFGVSAGTYTTSTGLPQGLISVTVEDANGCSSSASTTITQPTQLTASVGSVTNVQCFGASTGAININVGGGTGIKTFAWSNGANTEDLSSRPAGSYTITVTDQNSCTVSTSATISQPAAALAATSVVTNVGCFAGNTGAIDVTVTGGTGTYTYLWSNGQVSQDLTTLTSGSYTVTITDANGCTLTHNKTVTQPAAGVSISVSNVTNVACFGGSTGSITVSGSGGTAGYTYAINAGSFGASATFGSLAAGNYTLRVRDLNGCENSTPVTVTQPTSALSATVLSTTPANCFGSSTGAIDLGVSGGTSGYSYAWTNGATSQDLTNVAAGSYSVTVTDANSCTTTASTSVSQATQLTATAAVTNVTTCQGFSNGAITFTGSGGTGSYSFSINGGSTYQTSSTFTGLAAGTYDAWIRDNGVPSCSRQLAPVVISQPASLPAPILPGGSTYNSCGLLVVNVTPQGSGATRAILHNAIPGVGTAIDTNTAFVINNLATGTYTFYATSYNPTTQCQGSAFTSFTVTVTNPVLVTGTITNVSCFGAGNGAVDISVSGGTPPYTYSWSNGASSQDLNGVGGASYNVVVTDSRGCFNIGSFRVVEFAPINASLTFNIANGFGIRCFGDSSTQVTVATTGGDGNYSYIWNDGSTAGIRTDVYAGSFSVTVTDGQGCGVVKSATLFQPTPLTVGIQTSYQCSGGNYSSATLQVIPSGGVSPFEYKLNGGNYQSSNTFSNRFNGSVDTLYVRDANNCITIAYNTVTLPAPGSALNSCDFIYVAPSSQGGDVNNAGTPDCPTTLAQAMNLVSGTRTYVRMLGGASQYFYSSPVQLVNNVNIEGGYERDANGNWIKNSSINTVVNFDNAYANPAAGIGHYVGIISTGNTGWSLSDVTLNVQLSGAVGTQDGNGRSVYGLLINNASSNYTLSNIKINTGNASSGANGLVGDNGINGSNGAPGAAGQFIQDNTGGTGPFAACCGGGDGGTGGNGGGTTGGTGSVDPGAGVNGSVSMCAPVGSSAARGGGGGGAGGHGGHTSGTTVFDGRSGARGGGGGRITGCTYNASGAAVATNSSNGFTWFFYSQPTPAPTPAGVAGNNGSNGSNASLSYTAGNRPNATAFNQYFIPGAGADGGDGFGGSGGSGGGGVGAVIVDGRGGTPSFLNIVRGSGGGSGAGGGEGGKGGDGGGGGGSVFGVYVSSNSRSGASLTGVIVNSLGSNGTGGIGANGGAGGAGGFGGQGGPAMSDTQLGIVLTSPGGNGGNGGSGGNGGRGQDGDNGTASNIYFGGVTAPTQTAQGNNGVVTVNTIKACTNSIIPITKTSNDNWVITGGSFVRDLTASTSSFTAASDTASIFYTSTGNKNVGVGTTTYNGLIKVTGTRPVPVISGTPFASRCEGSTINLSTTTTGIQYRWTISNADSPQVILSVLTGQTINNLLIDAAGTYIVRLQVREECCGWSIPAYASVVVNPLPLPVTAINGAASVCAGSSVTYSAPLSSFAAANANSTTGYKWQLPAGAVATSAGGLDGFVSGGNINITVTFGTNNGNITVTPSNACGDGDPTVRAITILPTPVITGISGTTSLCAGTTEILTPVVTGGTSYTYAWSNGATTSSISVSPLATTTYTVTVTQGTCSDVESKTITVTPSPAAAAAITGLGSVYYGQTGVTYTTTAVANATSYNWTVPSGATITSGQGTLSITVNFGTATSGNVTVTPVNGTCNGTPASRAVTVTAAPFVWTGNVNTTWHVAGNWSTNTVPTASTNVLIPAGRPNYPADYTTGPVANHLIIENGASVTLEAGQEMNLGGDVFVYAGGTLEFGANIASLSPSMRVAGNWKMFGTMTPREGIVYLDGTTAQTIEGTSTFNHLELENTAGVSIIGGTTYVRGGLNLDEGTITTNDRLVIKSDALGTGWVDNFSAGMNGTINGDIIMQRYFPSASVSTAFHYIGSPVNNMPVSQLSELSLYGADGGQVIPRTTCDPNNVAPNSPYGNLFEWRENANFLFNCNQAGWHVRSAGNLSNGRGYAGIIRRTTDFTLEVKGTANTGTISNNNLANTTAIGDGWHMVSNPYPSPIEWNVPSGFIGAAHFWQSSGAYTGTYQPTLSGIGATIPSMQGFFIQTSGAGPANFTLTNTARRTGDAASFNRQANWYDHILNVELTGNNFADRTTVYFGADCTDAWDDLKDAQKKESRAGQPTLYTRIANYPKLVGINGMPNNSQVVSVPMGMIVGTAGNYTFTFADMSTFDPSALIYLEDLKTGTIQNMRANDTYAFTATLSDDPERFIIHFYPPANVATTAGDCEGLNGAINVDLGVFNVGGSQLVWDSYELTNAAGTVVSSNTNVNGTLSFSSMPAGNYNLNLNIQGYSTTEAITITAPASVDANYVPGFSQAYTQAILEFTNQSVNATDFVWTFGDGTTSNLANPTHIYTQPGTYDVTLVANSTECSDTYTAKVEVLEVAVGLPSDIKTPSVSISSYQDVVTIGFLNLNDPSVQVDIFDLTGRKIIETLTLETAQSSHQLKMSSIPTGYYFVKVSGTNTYSDKKIFLTSDK